MGPNYFGAFEDWEVAIARKLSSEFLAQHGWIRLYGLDDLVQECLIQWGLARQTYRPEKAVSRQTYMAQVVRHRLQNILAKELAEKRKGDRLATSLDQPVSEEGMTLKEVIPATMSIEADVSLRHDLEQAMARLTAFQKSLCVLLREGYNITEIAAIVHKSRPTIYDEIARVNKVFADAGLDKYLT
jgi:RNA polymerase sigma factor (sigma-70 family)